MNRNRLLFLQIQTLPLIIHHKLKELFVLYTEQPLGNHVEDKVLTESPIEFKDNSITSW